MAEPKENEFLDDIADAEAEEFAQSLDELDDEAIEIDELRAERDELKDRWMRALADAENARKRGDKARREAEQYGGSKLARDMLPVFDNMKRAVETITDEQKEASAALIEGIELPVNYSLKWGGDYEQSSEAQQALASTLAVPYLAMVLVTVLLFARVRQPLMIWLVVPMAICGVSFGLLLTGQAFGFMALLGLLSLTGMLIKNAVVLVDEIDRQIDDEVPRLTAIIEASASRLRPVMMAAGTTVLGMVPLLFDPFFANMAVTIMGGLGFATLLTLLAVPCLYLLFMKVRPEETA